MLTTSRRLFARSWETINKPIVLPIVDSEVKMRIQAFMQKMKVDRNNEFIGKSHELEMFMRDPSVDGFIIN